MIAGGFLVLGAVLAFVFNLIQESRRAKRGKVELWDQNVLDHTSRVMKMTRQLIEDSFDHETVLSVLSELAVDQMQHGETIDPPPIGEPSGKKLYETFDALMSESSSLQIVAPQPVREAVTELQRAAGDLYFISNELPRPEKVDAVHKDLDASERSVRKHFGIKG